jgi:class 3 adenylate cyclase
MGQKTILELDLVGYSDVARNLEQQVGVEVVARFNDQIQGFVDDGLATIHSNRKDVVRATTGDGAILVFENAADAHAFAVAVLEAARTYNVQKSVPAAERWFRVGIASGDIHERDRATGGREIAGAVIANAVRLESAARPGQIVADSITYALLPKMLQALYGDEEIVEGKRKERFAARRYTVVPLPFEDSDVSLQESVGELFQKLNPPDQLSRLMQLVGMPKQFRPSPQLPLHQRQDQIVDWATGNSSGLRQLEEQLKALIAKQSSSPHR